MGIGRDFEQLINLSQRLHASGAVDDAQLVHRSIKGLIDMALGAERLLTISRALTTLSEKRNDPSLMVLADGAKEWGLRLRAMAVEGEYKFDLDIEQRLPSNYVQPDDPD